MLKRVLSDRNPHLCATSAAEAASVTPVTEPDFITMTRVLSVAGPVVVTTAPARDDFEVALFPGAETLQDFF